VSSPKAATLSRLLSRRSDRRGCSTLLFRENAAVTVPVLLAPDSDAEVGQRLRRNRTGRARRLPPVPDARESRSSGVAVSVDGEVEESRTRAPRRARRR